MSVGDITVRIDTEWTRGLIELIGEVKRSPTTDKLAELSALIEAHTDRRLSVDELFAERESTVARLRQSGVLLR